VTTDDLRLERFDPARDTELLHSWVVEERARFWMMGEHTLEEVREIYTWLDEQPTHHVWLVKRGDEPLALFQDYLPGVEEVGEHYDVREGDLGIHFMLADTTSRESGLTGAITAYVLGSMFSDPVVQRVVAEPDARNDKAVALVRRLGFELGPVVELSTKPAQLCFLTRETWTQG
jgi:RimJ/RimL family protein N-acetyltransferase